MVTLLKQVINNNETSRNKGLVLGIFFLLAFMLGTNANGQVTTVQNWSNLYNGTSTGTQNFTYTVPAGSGSNRLLAVAIASSQTVAGARTITLTYGGRNLTLASGDLATSTIRQHTAIYYMRESDLDLAANTTLSFAIGGGTTRVTTVWAAVFDYVDQTTPITNSRNYNSGTSSTNSFAFATALTINANDQAVLVVSSLRSGSNNPRNINYATNFTDVDEQTNTNTDGTRNGIANRSVPNTSANSTCATTFSGGGGGGGAALASMTGMSIKACVVPTANAGAALTAFCKGGTSAALGGSVGGSATGGTWTSSAGGTFSPNATTLNATWTPPANYTGTATLTLTTSGGSCGVVQATKTQVVNPTPTDVTAGTSVSTICPGGSFNLTSDATSNSASGAVTVFSENFNGVSNNWTTTAAGAGTRNDAWTLRGAGGSYTFNANGTSTTINSNDNSQFYFSNSDAQGNGSTTETILQSPSFSTVGLTSATLSFFHLYRFNGSESANVDISTNGTSWTTLQSYNSNQGTSTVFDNPSFNLSSYLGQATVYIRFRYIADWDWYWAVDNVVITGVYATPPPATFAWTSSPSGFTSSLQNPTGVTASVATSYTVTATNSFGCTATASTSIAIGTTTTWTAAGGGSWSNGTPINTTPAVISHAYTTGVGAATEFSACSLTVNSNAAVVISSGDTVNLSGALTVATGSSFTLNNNANLLQGGTSNNNSGAITVNRNSSAILRQDYTLWSSPVANQGLYAFSKFTLPNRFYTYNTTNDQYSNAVGFNLTGLQYPSPLVAPNGVNGTDANNVPFETGKGYLIRTPWNHPTAPAPYAGQFTGIPNSGTIPYTMSTAGSGFNLVGNPYPSPISMTAFVADNQANITTSLYFWRETNNNSSNNAYCQWNNGIFQSNGQASVVNPQGVIRAGQGFFVQATGTSLVFTNDQRVDDNANQFFRENNQQDVYWLNLTNPAGVFSQAVVAYKEYATNGIDQYDGINIGSPATVFASTVEGQEFGIQGKASFVDTDVVPMSLKVETAGSYSIAIDHTIGVFNSGQTIYLKDNLLSTLHNLSQGTYNFTTEAGSFANRFEVVYRDGALSVDTPTLTEKQVVIYKDQANDFVINTGNFEMSAVKVFDIRGRLLVERQAINATQTTISAGLSNEVLLVQIKTVDGAVVTKKVIR